MIRVCLVLVLLVIVSTGRSAAGGVQILGHIRVGASPSVAVCGLDCRQVYVANEGSNSVSIIDTAVRREMASIQVNAKPFDIAFATGRRRLYVLGREESSLSIIDSGALKVTGKLSLTAPPTSISIAPDANKAYVTVYDRQLRGAVNVIDLGSERLTKVLSYSLVAYNNLGCPQSSAIGELKEGKTARLLYVSVQCVGALGRRGHDPIWVYSTKNDLPVHALHFKLHPNVGSVVFSRPGSEHIWASGGNACSAPADHEYDRMGCDNSGRDPISIIDTRKSAIVKQVFFAGNQILGFSPDGRYAFIGAGSGLLMVDADNFSTTFINLGESLGRIAVSSDGKYAYAPLRSRGAVAVMALSP